MILALLGTTLAADEAEAPRARPGAEAPTARRWELAAGPWVGHYAPQASAGSDSGLAWGGRARGRWTEAWGVELLLGATPGGVTGGLSLLRFLGDPNLDLVAHVAIGAGLRADGTGHVATGGGFDIVLTSWLDVRTEGRLELDEHGDVALLFAFAPVVHTVRRYDTDGDEVLDRADRCPRLPEDRDGHDDADGCPDPDNDGDHLEDGTDACPDAPEDIDGLLDRDGCPDPDDDEDGAFDALDACPRAAEDRDGFADADGCPDPDNDADTVRDELDHCSDVREDLDAFEDDDGCPDPDNDGDGFADRWDEAPLAPETHNGWEDDDGAPDVLPPVVARILGPLDARLIEGGASARVEGPGVEALAAVLASFAAARLEVEVTHPDAAVAAALAGALAEALVAAGAPPGQARVTGAVGPPGVEVRLPPPGG